MIYIGDKVTKFLDFTTSGVVFVFGESYYLHFVAFKVRIKPVGVGFSNAG